MDVVDERNVASWNYYYYYYYFGGGVGVEGAGGVSAYSYNLTPTDSIRFVTVFLFFFREEFQLDSLQK